MVDGYDRRLRTVYAVRLNGTCVRAMAFWGLGGQRKSGPTLAGLEPAISGYLSLHLAP